VTTSTVGISLRYCILYFVVFVRCVNILSLAYLCAHCSDSKMFYNFFHYFINVYKYYLWQFLLYVCSFAFIYEVYACSYCVTLLVKLDVRTYAANLKYDKKYGALVGKANTFLGMIHDQHS